MGDDGPGVDQRGLQARIGGAFEALDAHRAATSVEPEVDPALRAAVVDGPLDALLALVTGGGEADRAEAFRRSEAWLDAATGSADAWTAALRTGDVDGGGSPRSRAGLAWLALAPKAPLLKTLRRRAFTLFARPEAAAAVLLERRPPWLGDLAGRMVAAIASSDPSAALATAPMLPAILDWVATGLVERPAGKAWLIAVQQLGEHELVADPHLAAHELVDSLPVQPPGLRSWEPGSLHLAGAALASAGTIDRLGYADGLLAAAEETGQRWMVDLAEGLLDPDEAAARVAAYVRLAVADIGRIPVFTRLDQLDRVGRVPVTEAALLGPALANPTRKWALVALRLVATAAADPHAAQQAGLALAAGLRSPHDQVVAGAAAALAEQGDRTDDALRTAVAAALADLRPDQAQDLASLLAPFASQAPSPADTTAVAPRETGEDRARADALPDAVRAAFELDEVLAAWRDGTRVPPLRLDHRTLPVTAAARAIAPIPDADALAERFLAVIGGTPDAITLDLLLDGVQRFAGIAPRTDLADRLRARYGRGFPDWEGLARGVARLAGCWIDDADLDYWYPVNGLVPQRLVAAAARTRSGRPGPALATPTHHGGWIDPVTLAARLDALTDAGLPALGPDVVAAALRVAPDPDGVLARHGHPLAATFASAARDASPAEASSPAGAVPGATGPDLLGDLAPIDPSDGADPVQQAGEAGELDESADPDLPLGGPGFRALVAQTFAVDRLQPDDALALRAWAVDPAVRAAGTEPRRALADLQAVGVVQATVAPEDLPAAGALAVHAPGVPSTARDLAALLDPDLGLPVEAWDRVAASLCGWKDAEAVAGDVIAATIDDDRLDPQALAGAIARHQDQGLPGWARLAKVVLAASGRGAGPAELGLATLEHLVVAGTWPRSPAPVLDALRAASIAAGRRPSAAYREVLASRATGSSKTAQAARAVLALDLADDVPVDRYARALAARLDRARRFGQVDPPT